MSSEEFILTVTVFANGSVSVSVVRDYSCSVSADTVCFNASLRTVTDSVW